MKLPWTKGQILLALLGGVLLLGMFGRLAARWDTIPPRVPVHYNLAGEIDRLGSRVTLWTLPMIGATIWLTIGLVVSLSPRHWNMPCKVREENAPRVYAFVKTVVLLLSAVVLAFFALFQTYELDARPLPRYALPLFLGAVSIVILGLIAGIFRLNRPE